MKPDLVQRVEAECIVDGAWPWHSIKIAGRVLYGISWENCYKALGRYLRQHTDAEVIELKLKNAPEKTPIYMIFDTANLKLKAGKRQKTEHGNVWMYTAYKYLEKEEFITPDSRKPTGRWRTIRAGNLMVDQPIYEEK